MHLGVVELEIAVARGEWAQAEALHTRLSPAVQATGDPALADTLLVFEFNCAMARGDRARAGVLIDQIDARLDPDLDAMLALDLLRRAEALLPYGRVAPVQRALAVADDTVALLECNAIGTRALLAEAVGNDRSAMELHAQAADLWTAYGDPYQRAKAVLGIARSRRRLGDPAEALLIEAKDVFERLRARPRLEETMRLLQAAPPRS